jgi:putative ABC transport system permease protein
MSILTTMLMELRSGVRTLLRTPGFLIVTAFTLALGIGANTFMFSIADVMLNRPFPFLDAPERLIWFFEHQGEAVDLNHSLVSAAALAAWRAQSHSFSQVAAVESTTLGISGDGNNPEQVRSWAVEADYFPILGAAPILGRTFRADEAAPGAPHVAVLGHSLWASRFAADPAIVGKRIKLEGISYTVVGVMGRGVGFPAGADLWTPLAFTAEERADWTRLRSLVIGRLRPDVSIAQAQAEMDVIARQIAEVHPASHEGVRVDVLPAVEVLIKNARKRVVPLQLAVLFVLLIACANVANLQLSRGAGRQKEIALRVAIGATPSRIVRQLMTESVILALIGAALGVLVSMWAIDLFIGAVPREMLAKVPRLLDARVSGRVLGFTLVLSLASGVLFGLWPALRSARPELTETLKEGGRGTTGGRRRRRLSSTLVVLEMTLAIMLLTGAGLTLRSLIHGTSADPGYRPDGLLAVELPPVGQRRVDSEDRLAVREQLRRQVAAMPGVSGADWAGSLPVFPSVVSQFEIEGVAAPASGSGRPRAAYFGVGPSYFEVMGIPLLAGRAFSTADTRDKPEVAVINRSLAKRFFPDGKFIGKRLRVQSHQKALEDISVEIVGLVGDVQMVDDRNQSTLMIYRPAAQESGEVPTLMVRAAEPLSLAAPLHAALATIDPDQPIQSMGTMEQAQAVSRSPLKLSAEVFLVVACIAMLLAGVGIFSLIGYSVHERTHEIGIRMALGADAARVLGMIMAQGLRVAGVGMALGLGGAWLVGRGLAAVLVDVSPGDPLTFGGVTVIFGAVALAATYLPARRATAVDPMIALRSE